MEEWLQDLPCWPLSLLGLLFGKQRIFYQMTTLAMRELLEQSLQHLRRCMASRPLPLLAAHPPRQ